ncbi:MAG: Nramp family divalent metal transporter [Chroococcidiopsidaceae cyanobacterium CP_BM_RX_35]|nr:Nramp family divalent metal transporter [Chroococcidiopsidaceae cyanobacterium CP_BM_RX_35]
MPLLENTETQHSIPEAYRSISIPEGKSFWRKLFAFAGPGYMVSVGYMDPGNWATDITGGAQFGYTLLSVILLSNFIAILLQSLCVRLGVATERDLAQSCHDHFSPRVNIALWILAEIGIIACDLAEVIGGALALELLFHIPLVMGVCLTSLDVLLLLMLQRYGFRYVEALTVTLVSSIGLCYIAEVIFSHPDLSGVMRGFVPQPVIVHQQGMLYAALGILGATVMPHNLYLHSALVQTRAWQRTSEKKQEAIKFGTLDSTIALSSALFVNAAILIVAAAAFHFSGHQGVAEIEDAYKLLSPLLGAKVASLLFALALLASGQSSTLTATLAGQIVMEGFLNLRLAPWFRRLISRLSAIIPTLLCIVLFGQSSTTTLLIFSQVLLSFQLSFAVIPLVIFTSNRRLMGEFVNSLWLKLLSWSVAVAIAGLNIWLVWQSISNLLHSNP